MSIVNAFLNCTVLLSKVKQSHSLLGSSLIILVLANSTFGRSPPLTTPTDIVSFVSLDWRCDLKEKNRFYLSKPFPDWLFLLGKHQKTSLYGLRSESKHAFQNSAIRLYSLGINYRTLLSEHILGVYGFLDFTLKENIASINNLLNLCNFNVGFESITNSYQIHLNFYVPLHSYRLQSSDYTLTKVNNDSDTLFKRSFYIESGNFASDITISRYFPFKKYILKTSVGAYAFCDQLNTYKTFIRKMELSPWIMGAMLKLTWQWNDSWHLYTKISLDTTERPLAISLGLHYRLLTHNFSQSLHQALWAAPIERHVSPLLAPRKANIPESVARHTLFIEQCEEYFEVKKLTAIREVETIMRNHGMSIPYLVAEKNEHFESIATLLNTNDTEQILKSMPRKIHLAIHPDKDKFRQDAFIKMPSKKRRAYFIAAWPELLTLTLRQNERMQLALADSI